MALIIKSGSLDTNKENKRNGFAYSPRTSQMNVKDEIIFKNSFIMRNRESTITDSKNVFEAYNTKDPKTSENYIFIGRSGDSSKKSTKNINYIELSANADLTKKTQTSSNGQVRLQLSEDRKETQAYVSVSHGSVIGDALTGGRTFASGYGDGTAADIGGVQLSHLDENNNVLFAVVLDKDGIQMFGLPTSSSGLTSGAIWNSSGTLKIVT